MSFLHCESQTGLAQGQVRADPTISETDPGQAQQERPSPGCDRLGATRMEPPAPTLDASGRPDLVRAPARRLSMSAWWPFVEVLLCSDFPTQIALALLFAALGLGSHPAIRRVQLRFVAPLLLTDTRCPHRPDPALLCVRTASGPRRAFSAIVTGRDELWAAVPMIVVAYGIAIAVMLTRRRASHPWLHTVEQNPLQDLLRTPRDAALFAVVVVIAGGVREEVQRAFILTPLRALLGRNDRGRGGLERRRLAPATSSRASTRHWPPACWARSGACRTCGAGRSWHRW